MSATKAPPLTALAGCPDAGFVLWQALTGPPNTVAHELNEVAINAIATICNTLFFILILNYFVILLIWLFGFARFF